MPHFLQKVLDLTGQSEILATLSLGERIITLSATDTDGNTTASSISVFVGYRIHLPVVLRESS
jgi:hypothetical protein